MAWSGWVESIGVTNKDTVFVMLVGLAKQFDIQVLVLRTYPQYLCSRVNNKEGKRVSNALYINPVTMLLLSKICTIMHFLETTQKKSSAI